MNLVKEHRRKTEIDRTHNAAVEAMETAAKQIVHDACVKIDSKEWGKIIALEVDINAAIAEAAVKMLRHV